MFKHQLKHILSVFKDQHKVTKNYKVAGKCAWCSNESLNCGMPPFTMLNLSLTPAKSSCIVKGSVVCCLPLMNKGHQGAEGTHQTVQRSGCVEDSHQSQDLNSSLEKSCSKTHFIPSPLFSKRHVNKSWWPDFWFYMRNATILSSKYFQQDKNTMLYCENFRKKYFKSSL